jgi:hypothetical protein
MIVKENVRRKQVGRPNMRAPLGGAVYAPTSKREVGVQMAMGTRHPLTRWVPASNGGGFGWEKTHGSTCW